MGRKRAITLTLEPRHVEELDRLVRERRFASKSQAVRLAIDHLLNELKRNRGSISTVKCPICSAPLREHGGSGTLKCFNCGLKWRLVPKGWRLPARIRCPIIYIPMEEDEDEEAEA